MYLMILAVPYYLFFFKGMKVSAELFSLSFPDVNKKRFRITIIYLNKVNWFLPVFLSFRTGSDEAKPGGSGGFPRPRSRPRRRPRNALRVLIAAPNFIHISCGRRCQNSPAEGRCFASAFPNPGEIPEKWPEMLRSHRAPSSGGVIGSAPPRET